MRKPSRRVLPTVIGVTVITTLAANIAVIASHPHSGRTPKNGPASLVAAANDSTLSPTAVAPLKQRLTPDLLVAAPTTLGPDVIAKLRADKQIRGVEVVDAVQAYVAGKQVGVLGVDPSTFRTYTPKPTAESDPLWRNVAAGDIAISFELGNDGGVKLASNVPIGNKNRQVQARVGAFATMAISDVDAVVSHSTAQSIGMPSGNAVIISAAPKVKVAQLNKWLTKNVLPKTAKSLVLSSQLQYAKTKNGVQQLPTARGTFMTADQINTALRAAYSKLGVPYVWGGTGPDGYDCSGLMQYALGVAGIRMPRVAADQARTGVVLPYSQARIGDLLIFANDPTTPGRISHIAMYVGGGKMIEAPHTGDVVKIWPVYTSTLRGVVRVNPQLAAQVAAGG